MTPPVAAPGATAEREVEQEQTTAPAITKVTVNLPEETVRDLRRLARKQGISMTQVLRYAIALESFVVDERSGGSKLLIERADGRVREVVIR